MPEKTPDASAFDIGRDVPRHQVGRRAQNGRVTGTDSSAPAANDTDDDENSARVRNPWGQGDRLRGQILVAAGQLLGDLGGAEGLSVRGVARKAGIAPAGIYAHFAGKADLVEALVSFEYGRLVSTLRAARGPDPVADLRAKVHAFCRFSMDNPGLYRLLFGRVTRADADQAGTVMNVLAVALRACEQDGHPLRLPAERAAIVLVVGTHGRAAIQEARSQMDRIDIVLDFADELLSLVFEAPIG